MQSNVHRSELISLNYEHMLGFTTQPTASFIIDHNKFVNLILRLQKLSIRDNSNEQSHSIHMSRIHFQISLIRLIQTLKQIMRGGLWRRSVVFTCDNKNRKLCVL